MFVGTPKKNAFPNVSPTTEEQLVLTSKFKGYMGCGGVKQ